MASAFILSPIRQPGSKFDGSGSGDASFSSTDRRRRKETVNERVEHILRGAMRDAEEEALQEREGGPETRGRALQRSRQLASLYDTSTEHKFLRSRAKRSALIELALEKAKRPSMSSESREDQIASLDYSVSAIGEGDESDGSDDETSSVGRVALASPIKVGAGWNSSVDLTSRSSVGSPVKQARPWYNSSPNASLKPQVALGITLDAKLRRYGGRGTAKLVRSAETLEPLLPNRPVAAVDEFVPGLSGSPSLWPPNTFHPSGSRLSVTMTRCPSSPIAIAIEAPAANNLKPQCHLHAKTHGSLQQKAAQKLQVACKQEEEDERKQRMENEQDMSEWQSHALHFKPPPELVAHRQQQQDDPQFRHRRTKNTAILQTPGYSPEKQRGRESHDLHNKRFALRWRSYSFLLDAMRRTPCRRPVLKDMEKLFALARELCALNALGSCMLSRTQFTLLITREFPLCDLKYVNRLFSSYDWEIRDTVDARLVLGTIRAMRVQQGEPVEIICASLRDFDDSTDANSGGADENKALVSTGASLGKAMSLCCATDDEEKDMMVRADAIWTKVLAWQRQILAKRLNGGSGGTFFGTWSSTRSNVPSRAGGAESIEVSSRIGDQESVRDNDGDGKTIDEEDCMDKLPYLVRLVDESRVPVRRVKAALKREKLALELFTQQLLQRRHECMVAATTESPRR